MLKALTTTYLCFMCMASAACVFSCCADNCSAQDSNIVEAIVFRGQSQAVFKKGLVTQLDLVISKLNDICRLSENQTAKIRLAGEVDIERFLKECELLRSEVEGIRFGQNREDTTHILATLSPLRKRIEAGFFIDSSLFAKTLYSVLTPEQLESSTHRSLLNRPFVVRSFTTHSLQQPASLEQSPQERLLKRH